MSSITTFGGPLVGGLKNHRSLNSIKTILNNIYKGNKIFNTKFFPPYCCFLDEKRMVGFVYDSSSILLLIV